MKIDELIRALRAQDKPDMEYGYDGEYKWNAELIGPDAADAIENLIAKVERLRSELATVTTERDAAVEDMKVNYKCCICKDYELCCKTPNMTPKCGINYLNFKWRGERSK